MGISACTDLEEARGFCLPGWSCTGAAFLLPLAPAALQNHRCTEHLLKQTLGLQSRLSLVSCLVQIPAGRTPSAHRRERGGVSRPSGWEHGDGTQWQTVLGQPALHQSAWLFAAKLHPSSLPHSLGVPLLDHVGQICQRSV